MHGRQFNCRRCQPMPVQSPAQESVAAELAKLLTCSIQDLRDRWRNLFKSKPSKAFGFDLLRRTIAQRLQEKCLRQIIHDNAARAQSDHRASGKISDSPTEDADPH